MSAFLKINRVSLFTIHNVLHVGMSNTTFILRLCPLWSELDRAWERKLISDDTVVDKISVESVYKDRYFLVKECAQLEPLQVNTGSHGSIKRLACLVAIAAWCMFLVEHPHMSPDHRHSVHVRPQCPCQTTVSMSDQGLYVRPHCPYQTTVSMSDHSLHVRPHCPYQTTVSMSDHTVHVRPRCPCQTIVSMSDHSVHVRPQCPCQTTVSMSDHTVHVRPRCPCQTIVSMSDHSVHVRTQCP